MLSRALFTLVLLGGLGLGSYAFGKYVLSSRLFGNKGSNLNQNFGETTVSAPRSQSGKSGQSATASVEILPEGGSSAAPRPAPVSPTAPPVIIDRSNISRDDGSARSGTADIAEPLESAPRPRRSRSSSASDDREREEAPRPRRRRRRRARPTPEPQNNIVRERPVRRDARSEPDVVVSNEGGSSERDTSSEPRAERIEPRREAPREDSSNEQPVRRRRRERVRTETPAPRERVRIEPRRETPRQESPIPQPESGGDDSPVPIPE